MKEKIKETVSITGSVEKYDAGNIMTFDIEVGAPLSKQIEHLVITLSVEKIEVFTNGKYEPNAPLKIYEIEKIGINGTAEYNYSMLNEIKPIILKEIRRFVDSEESWVNKYLELKKSNYFIKEFLYQLNFIEPILDPARECVVNSVKNGELFPVTIPFRFFHLSLHAEKQIQDFMRIRNEFLNLIFYFIDLKTDELKMLDEQVEITKITESDKIKEDKALEFWLGMKEVGLMSHLLSNDLSKHRKEFFRQLNLVDRNYNSKQSNYKKKKLKAIYLQEAIEKLSKKHNEKF
ncbi:hypothetical protein BH11BAC3_BH11BAC3_07380 [soil metagenome]